jgi:hypothetical protein
MSELALDNEWVVMQVRPHSAANYRTGALRDLAGAPAPLGSRVAMRLLYRAELTDVLMSQLRGLADRVVARNIHATSRKVVEGYWEAKNDSSLYFLFERGQRLRALPPGDAERVANAWAELVTAEQTPLDAGVLVEFLRADPDLPLDQAWSELRETLDQILTPVPAPPVQASVTEPSVIIQTAPAEARRLTLLALNWPTSTDVGQRAGSTASNPGQWAKDARDAGRLLGVWDQAQRTFRHPDFQFTADGTPRPEVRELLAAMAEHPDWTREADANGWRRTYWLYQPFRSLSRRALGFANGKQLGADDLEGVDPDAALERIDQWLTAVAPEDTLARTPAEVFAEDPHAVIAHARQAAAAARPDMDAEGRPYGR